jgi:alginate O-acetyltransferase complex protein AlgI
MLFNSIQFLIFFPIVTALYFILPHRFRWFLLLVASCIFYMSFVPLYILFLFFLIVVDYFAGISIEASQGTRRKLFLTLSIVTNLSFLGFFKYFNFANSNLALVASYFHWHYPIPNLNILLPIGLSFHTFQSMSYTVEVYRGNQKAERNLGILAVYVLFYPQLVAGPIERPQNLIHQFYEKHAFSLSRFGSGLQLMLIGFFKKVVIADRLGLFVDSVYNAPTSYSGIPLLLATYFFAFQIYCDFSGYSDIARGAARTMGFELMINFNRPYFSKSIAEFWKRWHISLSSWFRDYLYIPLGGNRCSKVCWYTNILIVFVLSGLWHGANWTFIIWGLLNGFYLLFSILTHEARSNIVKKLGLEHCPTVLKILRVLIVFHLVCFAWIFFRARNVTEARYIIRHCFDGVYLLEPSTFWHQIIDLHFVSTGILFGVVSILILGCIQLGQRNHGIKRFFDSQPRPLRWMVYLISILFILLFGVFTEKKFIYFQF